MQSFLLRTAAFLLLQLPIGYLLFTYGLTSSDTNNYLNAIVDKHRLLQETEGPRVIFVGGSNVAFGIAGQLAAERLQRRSINFGLHGALGLVLPLNIVEQHVRDGDLIVVSPEYEVICGDMVDGDLDHLEKLESLWPEARSYSNDENSGWKRFLDEEGLRLVHCWVKRGQQRLSGKEPERIDGIYRRDNFNENGDMIGHYGAPSSADKEYPPLNYNEESIQRAATRLNDFYQHCKDNNVEVVFSYPPLPNREIERASELLQAIDSQLRDKLKMPIINTPHQVGFPIDQFFDSQYHLTQNGAVTRTHLIAEAMREASRIQRISQSDTDQRH